MDCSETGGVFSCNTCQNPFDPVGDQCICDYLDGMQACYQCESEPTLACCGAGGIGGTDCCPPAQYYDPGSSICLNCPSQCSLCDSTGYCMQCKNGTYLIWDGTCAPCAQNCFACTNALTCYLCDASKNLVVYQGKCICRAGFTFTGATC